MLLRLQELKVLGKGLAWRRPSLESDPIISIRLPAGDA